MRVARWPRMTLPTTSMCERQCTSASVPAPERDQLDQAFLGPDARAPDRQRPVRPDVDWLTAVTARSTISLSISATISSVWLPASATRRSWNSAFALPNAARVVDRLLLRRRSARGAPRPRRARSYGPTRACAAAAGSMMRARLVDVGQRDVAELEHQRGVARGDALVGLVDHDAAAHAAHDRRRDLRPRGCAAPRGATGARRRTARRGRIHGPGTRRRRSLPLTIIERSSSAMTSGFSRPARGAFLGAVSAPSRPRPSARWSPHSSRNPQR